MTETLHPGDDPTGGDPLDDLGHGCIVLAVAIAITLCVTVLAFRYGQ